MITGKLWFGTLLTLLYLGLAIAAIVSAPGQADAADTSSRAGTIAADSSGGKNAAEEQYVPKSKRELRRTLSRLQYYVTQEAGTEEAFKNEYWDNKRVGTYHCIVCGLPLFESKTKYESGTGWPSFWAPIQEENIGTKTDWKAFYPRTEVHCRRCKAHLGHVFKDGPRPTGLRYCMNSAAMKFKPADKDEAAAR